MLRCVGTRFGKLSAVCLLVLLVGSDNLGAQPTSIAPACREYVRRSFAQQDIASASLDAYLAAVDKLKAVHTTLRAYVVRLRANPEEGEQVIRAILAVLQQMKQVEAKVRSTRDRWIADQDRSTKLFAEVENCNELGKQGAMTTPAKPPSVQGPTELTLRVLDRTMTVYLSWRSGTWSVTGRYQHGIKLPSHDPAASNATAPVKVNSAVTATAILNSPLPAEWNLWLGIGVNANTPAGAANLCGPAQLQCDAVSGPFPGVKMGLGQGWAASEGVEAWLCRRNASPDFPTSKSCVGRTDPAAALNISWTLP